MGIFKKVLHRFQAIYFKLNMFSKAIYNVPVQTRKEIDIFKTIFDYYADRPISIFEWGSGRSTIYYGKYLKSKNCNFQWHAVDNYKLWYEKIISGIKRAKLQDNVNIYLKEFKPFWLKKEWGEIPPSCGKFSPKNENELAYINLPKELNKKFDIIIIDARFRKHCVSSAKEVIAPGGVVVMHDAQKPHYHTGLEEFTSQKFFNTGQWYPFQELPNQMWIGSFDNNEVLEILEGY